MFSSGGPLLSPQGEVWLHSRSRVESGTRCRLTEDQVVWTLAEEGQDESLAEYWPRALRWRAEFDKCKYLDFSPLPEGARVPLEAYLRRHPVVGEAWLFPANRDPSRALDKLMASYYLMRAEKLAGLPHQKRGGGTPSGGRGPRAGRRCRSRT